MQLSIICLLVNVTIIGGGCGVDYNTRILLDFLHIYSYNLKYDLIQPQITVI